MGGFKNKKSRSKLGNPGGTGRPSGKFARLDEQEKREYINDAVHKHRYGTDRPKNPVDGLSSTSSSDSEDESPSVGRPPLNLVAMSPNKLRVRMSFLNSEKRKQQRLSEARRAAAMKRWNTEKDSDQEDHDEILMDSDDVLDVSNQPTNDEIDNPDEIGEEIGDE